MIALSVWEILILFAVFICGAALVALLCVRDGIRRDNDKARKVEEARLRPTAAAPAPAARPLDFNTKLARFTSPSSPMVADSVSQAPSISDPKSNEDQGD